MSWPAVPGAVQGFRGSQQPHQLGSSWPVGHCRRRRAHADEITARRQIGRDLAKHCSQTSPDPIALHRSSPAAAQRECHARPPEAAIGRERHPQQLAVESTTAAQCGKVGPAAARIDQALSRCRPLRRRAFTIARPARVDMRWRKPWRRARLRLWGWYVRFTLQPPGGSGRGQVREMRCGGRSVPGCRPESTDSLRVLIPSDARAARAMACAARALGAVTGV